MRLCSILTGSGPATPAVEVAGLGPIPIPALLGRPTSDLMDHLTEAGMAELTSALDRTQDQRRSTNAPYDAPYRHPGKIVGIGLNYRAHAHDLGEEAPRSSPVCFLKGDHTIIGPGDDIVLPPGIGRVTAEAELGLVFGRDCYRVSTEEAMDYVAGAVAVLDQTAEEVLLQNPRYLTRSKNYPTFFSFGPHVISMDEVASTVGELGDLEVRTVLDGQTIRSDRVLNMTFSPAELISFHSHVMPFHAGDILSTGTPGAVAIAPGQVVTCELVGLTSLSNPVSEGEEDPR